MSMFLLQKFASQFFQGFFDNISQDLFLLAQWSLRFRLFIYSYFRVFNILLFMQFLSFYAIIKYKECRYSAILHSALVC